MFTNLMKPMGPFLRQYVIVIAVNLSVLGSGLGLAWTSPVLLKLSHENSTILGRPITVDEGSWIVSIAFISGFLANYPVAYLADRIGRKYSFILAAVPRIACYLFLIYANELWMVMVGRLLVGVADAFIFSIVPMYASEIASKEIRGGLGTILQIFASLGIVVMLCMGPFLQYRILNEIVLCIVIATTVPLLFLPDSPYFLYKKGKTAEATKVLTFLRGSTERANEELKEYQAIDSSSETLSLREVIKSRTVLKALGIVIILGMGMQLTGFNAVQYYLQTILESTKTSVSSEMASVIVGLIQFSASLCTPVVIDRFGRKPILTVTLVGIVLGMIGLGAFFYLAGAGFKVVGFINYLPLISLGMVVFCFSAGLGSLSWVLMAELFEGRFRAVGIFFGITSSSFFIFLTTRFFAPLTQLIGPAATYWAFGVNSLCLCMFILYCVPETRGKSFLEIQDTMKGRSIGRVTDGGETSLKKF